MIRTGLIIGLAVLGLGAVLVQTTAEYLIEKLDEKGRRA